MMVVPRCPAFYRPFAPAVGNTSERVASLCTYASCHTAKDRNHRCCKRWVMSWVRFWGDWTQPLAQGSDVILTFKEQACNLRSAVGHMGVDHSKLKSYRYAGDNLSLVPCISMCHVEYLFVTHTRICIYIYRYPYMVLFPKVPFWGCRFWVKPQLHSSSQRGTEPMELRVNPDGCQRFEANIFRLARGVVPFQSLPLSLGLGSSKPQKKHHPRWLSKKWACFWGWLSHPGESAASIAGTPGTRTSAPSTRTSSRGSKAAARAEAAEAEAGQAARPRPSQRPGDARRGPHRNSSVPCFSCFSGVTSQKRRGGPPKNEVHPLMWEQGGFRFRGCAGFLGNVQAAPRAEWLFEDADEARGRWLSSAPRGFLKEAGAANHPPPQLLGNHVVQIPSRKAKKAVVGFVLL